MAEPRGRGRGSGENRWLNGAAAAVEIVLRHGRRPEKCPMTPQGAQKLREELVRLKEERPKISREIGVAREHGDLSENAEYHAAKERQGLIEARIKDIEDKLAAPRSSTPASSVAIACASAPRSGSPTSTPKRKSTYRIVGADEADIDQGTISVSSPLARALIGKEVGDEVMVKLPRASAATRS